MKFRKILHIANRAEKYKANRYYLLPYKMNNGFIRNGHCVYWFSDRDIARASALIPSRKLGVSAANRALLDVCNNFRPDVIVIAHADVIKNKTLQEIKNTYKIPIVQYNIDPFHDHNSNNLLRRNGYVDFTVITTGGSVLKKYANNGTKYAFIPNPIDKSIDYLENFSRSDLPVDAIFIGQTEKLVVDTDLRTKMPLLSSELTNCSIKHCYGIWGDSYLNLLSSVKIGLNLSLYISPRDEHDGDGSHHYLYSSDRISQYLGNGLMTFAEKKFCLSDVYGQGCLEEIEGYEELKDKIIFYSRNDSERKKRAEYSWKHAHAEFNEMLIAQYLLEIGTDSRLSYPYSWPTNIWG